MERLSIRFILLTLFISTAVLIVLSEVAPLPERTSAHSGDVFSALATVTPTIDGTISPGEWDDADCQTNMVTADNGELSELTICVKNDEKNLYVAVVVTNQDYSDANEPCFDFLNLTFNNEHTGTESVGDDLLAIRFDGFSADGFDPTGAGVLLDQSTDTGDGGTNDLLAAITHSNPGPNTIGTYTAEYEHPLDSTDDAHDFSLTAGDTVGFKFTMADGDPSPTAPCVGPYGGFEWPAFFVHLPPGWADIIIQPVEIPTATPTITPTPTPLPERIAVVFLEGIGTDLTEAEIDRMRECSDASNDSAFGEIKPALLEKGFVCNDFLRYSYRGGSVDEEGNWDPNTYDCNDTKHRLLQPVSHLHSMLLDYRQTHPDVKFVLIGHSLGGVIALETARILPSSIAAVITIDSPLNHASRQNLLDVRSVIGLGPARLFACPLRLLLGLNSPVAWELADVTADNQQAIREEKEALVTAVQAQGVRVMTIGNEQDCVWYLTLCRLSRERLRIRRGDDWIDDRRTMVIDNADHLELYPLGTEGCDLSGTPSGFRLLCLFDAHGAARDDAAPVGDIADFIDVN